MEITQDPKLQADRILSATVARTDAILRSASGRTALEATWLLNGHNGHSNLILKLKNPQGYLSSAEFDPAEFRNEPGISLRMEDLNAALARIAHWRSIVDELFERLRPWCERLGPDAIVCPNVNRVEERASGEYLARELMVVLLPSESLLTVTPVASWVLGWDGRIDLVGSEDRLSLMYSVSKGGWFHVPNYLPYGEHPLTETLFRELALACLDEQ